MQFKGTVHTCNMEFSKTTSSTHGLSLSPICSDMTIIVVEQPSCRNFSINGPKLISSVTNIKRLINGLDIAVSTASTTTCMFRSGAFTSDTSTIPMPLSVISSCKLRFKLAELQYARLTITLPRFWQSPRIRLRIVLCKHNQQHQERLRSRNNPYPSTEAQHRVSCT